MEVKDSLINPLKFAKILSRRSSHEYTELGFNIEYQASASPSATMTKDLAGTASFPPAEATAASKLMINWHGSDLPFNLGKVMGLLEGGQGELRMPLDSGDLESMVLWVCGEV